MVILSEVEKSKLLDALCVKLGFCLPADERSRIEEASPEDARTFTDAVFTGEGMNPELADRHLYRQVLAMVREAFDGRWR
ncbi:MAG: hypothetical protein EXR71_00010 [Myxococcales bacterium]|nr:hypothetical protein [Myxococcales bacterium]